MSTPDQKVKDFLTAIKNEPMKLYRTYDVNNRVDIQYETIIHIGDGGPCMKTTYKYDGTSSRVVAFREELDVWSSAYEIENF